MKEIRLNKKDIGKLKKFMKDNTLKIYEHDLDNFHLAIADKRTSEATWVVGLIITVFIGIWTYSEGFDKLSGGLIFASIAGLFFIWEIISKLLTWASNMFDYPGYSKKKWVHITEKSKEKYYSSSFPRGDIKT